MRGPQPLLLWTLSFLRPYRRRVLIPDSAHGTNPATAAMVGYEVATLPSDMRGNVDLEALEDLLDDSVAGLMITVPSTLGLFDEAMLQVSDDSNKSGDDFQKELWKNVVSEFKTLAQGVPAAAGAAAPGDEKSK